MNGSYVNWYGRTVLLALVIALVVGVTTAQAQSVGQQPYSPPGDRPAPTMQPLVNVVQGDWAARGVFGCSGGVEARWASDLGREDGVRIMGRGEPCRVWLLDVYERRRVLVSWIYACNIAEHEGGHALGLDHDDAVTWPVMAAEVGNDPACTDHGQLWLRMDRKLRRLERRRR